MLAQFFKKKQSPENQSGISDYAKDFLVHGYAHCFALAELFFIELGEYAQVTKRRAILALIGGVALALSYLSLWAIFVMYLWQNWCSYGALGVFASFHTLVATVFLLAAWRTKPGPLAPLTKEELNTDLTCIKLSLNENTKH